MILKAIVFRRKKDSKIEAGIEIEGKHIIDKNGDIVPQPVWNAKDRLYDLCINTDPILNELEKHKANDL